MDVTVGNKRLRLFPSGHFVGEFQFMLHLLDKRNIKVTTTVDQDTGKSQWMLLDTNAKTPGTDGDLNVLTCDFGLWLANRQSHALVRNIKKAA
jgi:hypothetical protein